MDFRPGGVWQHLMHGPDGTDYPNYSVFVEIVKPERIVYTHGGTKEDGPEATFLSTWTFEALGDKTRVTLHALFPSAQARDKVVKEFGAIEGGKQTLHRLGSHLAAVSGADADADDFVISRVFAAPRVLVFKAFTEPERMQHWWGPKGFTVIASTMDLRPGGVYHYGLQGPDGSAMWGKFVYREIVPPQRLVFVNSFSDEAGNITRHPMSPTWPRELLTTVDFADHRDGTLLSLRWALLPDTPEIERQTFRDARASMQQGWGGTMDQLATYLATQLAATEASRA